MTPRLTKNEKAEIEREANAPVPGPQTIMSVRVTAETMEGVRQAAERRGLKPSGLVRAWLADRLDREP